MLSLLAIEKFEESMELLRSLGAKPMDYATYIFAEYATQQLGSKDALVEAFEVSYLGQLTKQELSDKAAGIDAVMVELLESENPLTVLDARGIEYTLKTE